MTPAFASYLLTLSDLGKTIWLTIYAETPPNGTAIVNEKDLHSIHGITVSTLNSVFKPDLAHKKKLVEISRTESRLVIRFKKVGRKTNIEKAVAKQEKIEGKEQQFLPAAPSKEVGEAKAPQWQFTHELRVALIEDYQIFFLKRQELSAMLAGTTGPPIKPKIEEIEVVSLRRLAQYFKNIGCVTDNQIRGSLQKVYLLWEHLPTYYRGQVSPQNIYRNINEIINFIKTNPVNINTKQKEKDAKFNSKIEGAKSKDYGHLVGKGKKDDAAPLQEKN